jgi:hypothetical protein
VPTGQRAFAAPSILVNFERLVTIAGMLMAALHGIAPDIAVRTGVGREIRVLGRRDPLFAWPRQRHPAFPAQPDCLECPPLRHSLFPAPAVNSGNHGSNLVPARHRAGPDIAEGVRIVRFPRRRCGRMTKGWHNRREFLSCRVRAAALVLFDTAGLSELSAFATAKPGCGR